MNGSFLRPTTDDNGQPMLAASKLTHPEQLMHTLALMIEPIPYGWSVCLTDGRELARFRGPDSKRRALHYLAREAQARAVPAVVRRAG
jgi:hypothetical protein